MPVPVGDLTGDELREQRNTIRTWIQEELMPLAERVADRTDSDAGAQRHMPAILKGLLDTNVNEEVTQDLLQSFCDDNDYTPKDHELTLTKMRAAVQDLATMSFCVRTVELLTDDCSFSDTTSTNLDLDNFMENKWKATEKYLINAVLKHLVSHMYVAGEDDEEDIPSEDSDDEEDDDDDKAGIEKDSDDDSDGDEGSESGEPDSDAEEKMLKDAASESDDEGSKAPSPKRAKTKE